MKNWGKMKDKELDGLIYFKFYFSMKLITDFTTLKKKGGCKREQLDLTDIGTDYLLKEEYKIQSQK